MTVNKNIHSFKQGNSNNNNEYLTLLHYTYYRYIVSKVKNFTRKVFSVVLFQNKIFYRDKKQT